VDNSYPDGKLNDNDDGELTLLLRVESGRVIVSFPKPVLWVGMTPQGAIDLAQSLVRNAMRAGYDRPVTLTIT
jgi:hypothetical protein